MTQTSGQAGLRGSLGGPCLSPPPAKMQEKQYFFFFNFWLRWVFAAEPELSLVAVTGGSSLVVVLRLLIAVASLVAGPGLSIAGSAIWHMGLGTKACGIFQDQGSNLCPVCWQVNSQPLDCQGRAGTQYF